MIEEQLLLDTPRKERRDAAENRQQILAAARDLFATQGVDQTSMHEVARAAGVGQGTLYRRYAHKGELCTALLAENMQQFRERIEAELDHNTQPALDQLKQALAQVAAFNEANAPLLSAIGDAACGTRRDEAYQHPFYRWLHALVSTLLHRAVAQGEAAPLDVDATVDAVLATMNVDLYLYQRRVLGYSPEQIGYALCRLLFDGLRGPTADDKR